MLKTNKNLNRIFQFTIRLQPVNKIIWGKMLKWNEIIRFIDWAKTEASLTLIACNKSKLTSR